MKVMVKVCSAALSVLAASVVLAQTAGSVPPDYVPSGISPVDAQIQAVKQNYQEVQAAAQAELQARAKAAAAAQAKKDAAARAAANIVDRCVSAHCGTLLRLDVEKKRAAVGADAAINNETAKRAKDFVDTKIDAERAKVERIRAKNQAIKEGREADVK